ncbi:hypothetical protein [Thiohalorhabdus methylotrophus]|uniref:Sulfotransferase family protein n=1 Tax=Thiohalorhabdus methylotrophus TaxID=3242694 RepID=A0ABV4TW26_9GAMM
MQVFAHIGIPKTLTTSLQKDFFAQHPEIAYLGVGADGGIGYADEELERIFEHLLLYGRSEIFERESQEARKKIEAEMAEARRAGKAAFGVSLEWLSFRFSADMSDTRRSAHRLRTLLGPDTNILFTLRRQDTLLHSLYNEYVKDGLPLSWKDFLSYIYKFRERNFFLDLCYDELYESYAQAFGPERIEVAFLEEYLEASGALRRRNGREAIVADLSRSLGIAQHDTPLAHHNPSLPREALAEKLRLNRELRHDFGNLLFEHASLHRQSAAHARDRTLLDIDVYGDVRRKRMLIAEADARSRARLPDTDEVRPDPDDPVYGWLLERFREANLRLSRRIGRSLPEGYYFPENGAPAFS